MRGEGKDFFVGVWGWHLLGVGAGFGVVSAERKALDEAFDIDKLVLEVEISVEIAVGGLLDLFLRRARV